MTHIPAIDVNSKSATYNAVKIQINEPRTNIPEGFKTTPEDNNTYNAVDIEINRPSLEKGNKHHHCHNIYDYPCAECAVTSDMAPIHPVKVPNLPIMPVAYQTTNFINNRTLINAELEVDNKPLKAIETQKDINPEETVELIIEEETMAVPEPNVTTTEEQKANPSEISFNGLSFKANPVKQEIEIVPPVEIKPDVDIPKVLENLSDKNFDIQAKQMEDIAKVSMQDAQKAVPYIVTEVFSELENIVKKDSSDLTPPSEKQIELRQQIIVNEILKEQAKTKGENPETIELPYKISEKDIQEASELSLMEQAERNKEYALYTMAILAKVYGDEVNRHTGNIVPLTDMPGVSTVVDTLRNDSNSGVKIASIDALRYLYKPEYKEELDAILKIATTDPNPLVARTAGLTIEELNQ